MISPAARLVILFAVLAVPACTFASLSPGLALPAIMLVTLLSLLAAVDAWFGLRRIAAISTHAPTSLKWFKGREEKLYLQIQNRFDSTAALALSVDFPSGIAPSSPFVSLPRDQNQAELVCQAQERGRYQLTQCCLRSSSPLQLWHVKALKDLACEIRIFPNVEDEPGARLLMMRKLGGLRTQRIIGRGREFERLREYAPGDAYDEIAWKASARRGRPIVRVFQVERTQDVYAIIDSSRLGARARAIEQFVSASLMLAIAAENNGDNFGLVTFSDRVNHFVPPGRGRQHYSRCRDAIYDLQASQVSPDFAELFSFLQLRIRRRSLLLFLTDLADPLLAETFLRDVHLLSRRHLVLVNRLKDEQICPLFTGPLPQSSDEISLRLAGHMQWATLKDLERNLAQKGVTSALLTPGSVGLDLVRQYADVKRRQAL